MIDNSFFEILEVIQLEQEKIRRFERFGRGHLPLAVRLEQNRLKRPKKYRDIAARLWARANASKIPF